jgi:hypothetical protein
MQTPAQIDLEGIEISPAVPTARETLEKHVPQLDQRHGRESLPAASFPRDWPSIATSAHGMRQTSGWHCPMAARGTSRAHAKADERHGDLSFAHGMR